jgi:hypothetical protein
MSKDKVIFKTKKVSSKATGRGKTNIATSAIIPNGKNELITLGPMDLNLID